MGKEPLHRSFRHAADGLRSALQTERNLRIHLAAAAVVLALGALLSLPARDFALILFAIALVIVTELVNTAVERTVDLVTGEFHELAKSAKDIAAGAVFAAALFAVLIGLLVFVPHVLAFLG
ncbi:hypothetical protein BSNK01_01590 [Bacillaceae bacterium]